MTTLFDNTNTSTQTTKVDETKNYLEELVGEGKKFKSPEELARGKAEADAFIEQMKQEQARAREEITRLQNEASSSKRIQELLDKLEDRGTTTSQTNQTTTSGEPDGIKALTPDQVAEIIDQRVSQREKLLIETNNLQYVKNTLTETFGPNYTETLKSKALELSVGTEFLDSLARAQPKAFLELVGAKAGTQVQTRTSTGAPPASVNTQAFTKTNTSTDRTMSYYDKIKTASPKEYWSPKVQNQMHNDAIRLGPQFFDSP